MSVLPRLCKHLPVRGLPFRFSGFLPLAPEDTERKNVTFCQFSFGWRPKNILDLRVCCSVLPPARVCGDGACVRARQRRDVHMSGRRRAAKFVNEIRGHAPREVATNGVQRYSSHTHRVERPAANRRPANGVTVA